MIGPRPETAAAQVWIATKPVDMRKSFDGLAEVVPHVPGTRSAVGQSVRVSQPRRPAGEDSVVGPARPGDLLQAAGAGRVPLSAAQDKAIAVDSAQLLRLLAGLEIVARRAG